MPIGLLWVPNNLVDYRWNTCYTVTNFVKRDDIIYDFQIEHPADSYWLLYRWRATTHLIDTYMALPDEQGMLVNWLFRRATIRDIYPNGWFSLVCSNCNIERINVLPDILRGPQNLAARGVEMAGARRAAYL